MDRTWLVFDTNYLCHRAFYAMPELRHGGTMTGVTFGVFRDILHLQDIFSTKYIVFAFDRGPSKRCAVCPTYKANRPPKPDEFTTEVTKLRREYLPDIGYRNIFAAKGYEADDVIAVVCRDLPEGDDAIIVSADTDLYQLLRRGVSIYNPRADKMTTEASFTKEWGLAPDRWPVVKAIAGCSTDHVPGVPGVGEVTAAKYLRGELKRDAVAYRAIVKGRWSPNISLVALPFEGCPTFKLQKDVVTRERWAAVADRLGMRSIRDLPASMRHGGFGFGGKKNKGGRL